MKGPSIRLRIDGMPGGTSETAALVIHCALAFCAAPETFPVFLAHALADNSGHDWVTQIMSEVTPDIVGGMSQMVAAGVIADYEANGVTP